MKILRQAIKVKKGSRVQVHISRPATVYMMTEPNFKRYKDGASFKRMGGSFEKSPAEFIAPYDGLWYTVIEKGSHFSPKSIEGRVEVLPPVLKEISYFDDDDLVTKPKKSKKSKEEAQEISDIAVETEESENEDISEEEGEEKD